MGAVIITHPETGDTRKVTERAHRIVWEPRGYRPLTASATKDELVAAASLTGTRVNPHGTKAEIIDQLTPSQED